MDETKKITATATNYGFAVHISNYNKTGVVYPSNFLKNLSLSGRRALAENFSFCRTIALSLYFKNLHYEMPRPILANLAYTGLKNDLPLANFDGPEKTSTLFKKMTHSKIRFSKKRTGGKIIPQQRLLKKALLSLSFGRDSLLSFALAKEIGLPIECAFINDMGDYNPDELKEKKKIIKKFSRLEKQKVIFIDDNSDDIYNTDYLKEINESLAAANAMLSFTLTLLPIAYTARAKYIIFGNERDLDRYFSDGNKIKNYQSFDQSTKYMIEKNIFLKKLTNNNLQVISLVKPLYNLAELQIITHRYPHLIKYLMSCEGGENGGRACGHCIVCAWTSLYAAAFNIPHKNFGLKYNLFKKKDKNLFALFNPKIDKISEKIHSTKEEQLLAFLLAYRNDIKGYLIDLFEKKYLRIAEKKEKYLRKKFLGIHSFKTVPPSLRPSILKIFKEELDPLQIIN